jgi:signal transduction histidine kinase
MKSNNGKILVVDDTEGTRYAVVRTLKSAGFDTVEAATGQEALDIIAREIPDLVTLDIHLPDINGFEICRRIKAAPETTHIPVLQVSASYVTSQDRIHGLEGGADSYLTHPFEPPVLIATVKALLRSRALYEELKVAESEQKRMAEEASLANEAKTRFLSNMSHEIRTPLGIIQGFADLALDENLSAREREEYLLTIKRNAESLTRLLGDILDLSKVEAGKIEVEKLEFQLPDLIHDVISAFRLQTAENGLAIQFATKEFFPLRVTSDSTRVRQVLVNLVSNAVKFTQTGGITVTLSCGKNGDSHTVVKIEVKDTGIGMNEEQRGRLFQAFVQADSSITRKFGGTGLGLILSRRLAIALGGDLLLVHSQPGVGSRFEFSFDGGVLADDVLVKTLDQRGAEITTTPKSFANTLVGLKVLLVDDSEDNQILFGRYLAIAGAVVTLAYDGSKALEYLKSDTFDVILMDLQMPVLDGYAATEKLRVQGITTPVVALTAYAMREQWERALKVGFTDFVTKPVNASTLIKTILKVIGGYFGERPESALLESPR